MASHLRKGESKLPTYVYRCSKCKYEWEMRESFDSEPTKPCPECESESTRVFFPPPIRFLGGGWASSGKG